MLKHLLGYLRKTQNFKMVYKRNNNAVEVLFKQIGDRDVTLATLCASDQKLSLIHISEPTRPY